jgi:hypothetical protein
VNQTRRTRIPSGFHPNILAGKPLDRSNIRRGQCGFLLASPTWQEDRHAVAQRFIEVVIGRLITDEAFRTTFLRDPHKTLAALLEGGMQLTNGEMAALVETDSELWGQVAEQVDERLQKVNLKS